MRYNIRKKLLSSNARYYNTKTVTRAEEAINNIIDEHPEEPEQPPEEATIELIDEQPEEQEKEHLT